MEGNLLDGDMYSVDEIQELLDSGDVIFSNRQRKVKQFTFLIRNEMPPCCRGSVHAVLYDDYTWERYYVHANNCSVVD